jgi:hypothetical protein
MTLLSLKKIIISCILLILLISNVSAAPKTSPDFFPQFVNGTDIVHYNQTQTYHDEMLIPREITYFLFGLGFILFILSRFATSEHGNDLFGFLAIIPFFVATWSTLQMDFVYTGVTSQQIYVGQSTYNIWVMMTEHNIYHELVLFAVFALFAIFSIINFIWILIRNSRNEIRFNKEPDSEKERSD